MANACDTNWLEKLAAIIPGYGSYLDKEHRRDVDKQHREHLASQLQGFKGTLTTLVRDLSENGRLFETKPVEQASTKLEKLAQRILYASYGYSGFFDLVKIREAELDRIYRFDLDLVEDIATIKSKVEELAHSKDAESLKVAAKTLESALDALDSRFSERYQAIAEIK